MTDAHYQTDRIQAMTEKEAGAEGTREYRVFGPP